MRKTGWIACLSVIFLGALLQGASRAEQPVIEQRAGTIQQELIVASWPVSGVTINGTHGGTTQYSCEADWGSSVEVTLNAYPTIVSGGTHYLFDYWWVDTVEYPKGQNIVSFDWQYNMSVIAYYTEGEARTLTVNSGPVPVDSGVSIGGTAAGITPYTAAVADGATVTLTALQPTVLGPEPGNLTYWFVQWVVAGKPQPVDTLITTFDMTKDITATAMYTSIKLWRLNVSSSPVAGITISGTAPGATNYTANIQNDTLVALAAPTSASVQGVSYTFQNWDLNGAPQAEGVTDLAFYMTANMNAQAIYLITDRNLTVQSSPITGVTITGSAGGSTNYSTIVPDHTLVNLTAPASVVSGPDTYAFKGWSGLAAMKETALTQYLYITADTTLTATYGKIEMAVTYPKDTGVILERGKRASISWNSSNLPQKTRVKVRLVKGGTTTWTLSATATKSPLQWTVGAPIADAAPILDGTDYTIQVSALNDTVLAESENPFSIGSVESLTIDGPARVQGGSAPPQYTCTAHYNIGGELDVTSLVKWSCLPSTCAKMGKTGLLATKPVLAEQPFQLIAAYGKGKPPITSAPLDVTVTP